jgi:hypothetical protein
MDKERHILTEEEKVSLLNKYKECYICQESLEGYSREEIYVANTNHVPRLKTSHWL